MKRLKNVIFHPLLAATYPVVALLAHNIEEVEAGVAMRALLVSLAGAALLFLLLRLLLRSWEKAGWLATLTLLLFFSYGHAYTALRLTSLAMIFGRHRLLAPLFFTLWGLALVWVVRRKGNGHALTQALHTILILALIWPLVSIGRFYVASFVAARQVAEARVFTQAALVSTPDVYYIILDGYSRQDTLQQFYHFDNTSFLDALTNMGFYVARCSQSNYAQTQLSLASSLSMKYLQDIDELFRDPKNTSRVGLASHIRESAAREFLATQGYRMVAFETGYYWTQVDDADVYLAQSARTVQNLSMLGGANDFEVLLIKTTGWLLVADTVIRLPSVLIPDLNSPNMLHRQRVLYILEVLPDVPRLPGPKFVFAHIVVPHKPFVFGPNGEVIDHNPKERIGYRDQVIYINQRILPILQQIIDRSANPPIIILQSDHGGVDTDAENRMRILNAYYLPGDGVRILYPTITPVNSFRLIFNHYFGANNRLQDDRSYFSVYQHPFDFTLFPNTAPGCRN